MIQLSPPSTNQSMAYQQDLNDAVKRISRLKLNRRFLIKIIVLNIFSWLIYILSII